MKKILLLLSLILTFAFAAQAKSNAKIEFAKEKHDFGMISESGGPVSTDFIFTNTGKEPLVIYSATAQCGCTKPSFPDEPIMPGKSGKIHVSFNPKTFSGAFRKSITIRSNASKSKKTLHITGTINPNR